MKPSMREYYVETYGPDDWEDGDTLRFYKQFDANRTVYTYVAVKAQSAWYVTGKDMAFSWYQLWEFFEQDNLLDAEVAVFYAPKKNWSPLFEEEEDES